MPAISLVCARPSWLSYIFALSLFGMPAHNNSPLMHKKILLNNYFVCIVVVDVGSGPSLFEVPPTQVVRVSKQQQQAQQQAAQQHHVQQQNQQQGEGGLEKA